MRPIILGMILAFLQVLSACGASSSTGPARPEIAASTGGLQASIASSDLAVGNNRFTFGLLNSNHPIESGRPRLTFYLLHGTQGRLMTRATAYFNQFSRGLKDTDANSAAIAIGGVFVARVRFGVAGTWGVEIRFPWRGKVRVLREGFTVAEHSQTPAVGSPAPRSRNPTVAQMPATKLDSGRPPDDMHKLSIAAAIAQHKPLVVLFATAAFCTSRMCGPEIETVEGIERQFRGRVNFVHIEIYQDANPANGFAPTVKQWHLHTEPWVFVVDRSGIVAAKFEGPTPASEIVPVIQKILRA